MSSKKIELDHKDMVHDSAIDYYGKRLATASSDSTVKITSIGGASAPSHLVATLTGHYGPVWRVGWAHPKYGSILASCGYDGRVIVWKEGATGQWSQAHVFGNHKSLVNSIAWAPYELGLSLACGSSDGTISVMSMRFPGTVASCPRGHRVREGCLVGTGLGPGKVHHRQRLPGRQGRHLDQGQRRRRQVGRQGHARLRGSCVEGVLVPDRRHAVRRHRRGRHNAVEGSVGRAVGVAVDQGVGGAAGRAVRAGSG